MSNGSLSSATKDSKCNQMKKIRQITIICVLESDSDSTSQHSTTLWSEHRAFHQSTQYHMVVRSSRIPPVNTVPHGGQIMCIPPVNTVPHGGQIIVHFTSQHSTTWRSDHRAFHQSTQYHTVVRLSCVLPINTVPHGGQIETL